MQRRNTCVLALVAAVVLAACGGSAPPTTTSSDMTPAQPRSTAPSPTAERSPTGTQATDTAAGAAGTVVGNARVGGGDPVIVPTLAELVQSSPLIFIGAVVGPGEIINLARDVNDVSRPDPALVVLGQVYRVDVERYLAGTGPMTQNIVQPEGFVYNQGKPIAVPTGEAAIEAAKAGYAQAPMRPGTRYLFFVRSLDDLYPEQSYATGAAGYPWRFTLPANGTAQPDSPVVEANELYPARPSAALLGQVGQLIQARQ